MTIFSALPKYKCETFVPHDNLELIPKESIVICKDRFGQFKEELQVVRKDISDSELQRNVVGKVVNEELFMLDYLLPWQNLNFSK